MRFLTNPSTDPWYNMSFDEYCLEQYPSNDCFFYLWRNRPSVIIGLNQNAYSEVNLAWLDANGTAELTGRNDIFVDGRKVSGYARRLWRDRQIIHGTLMYDVDLDTLARALDVPGSKLSVKGVVSVRSRVANLKDYLPQFASLDALQAALQEILAAGDGELPFGDERRAAVRRLSEEKFSTWEWIYGQSREADLVRRGRLACGTVEVRLCLDRGRLTAVEFGGDFLGALPASALADRLVGLRFERSVLQETLDAAEVNQYFDGVSPEALLDLIFAA